MMVDSSSGACRFCGNVGKLCNSHSIPNGIFRLLMQAGGGSAIDISTGPGKIKRTSETGSVYLLCKLCENDFNKNFDAPAINVLKLLDQQIQDDSFSARISFSHDQMAKAITSIIWRCCESDASLYDSTKVCGSDLNKLKRLTETPQDEVLKYCSVIINRLQDNTENGFDQKVISKLIIAPVPRSVISNKGRSATHFGFFLVLQGFLIHLIVPKLPYFKANQKGYLKQGFTRLHAPPTGILEYPTIMKILVEAIAKHEAGHVTKGVLIRTNKNLSTLSSI